MEKPIHTIWPEDASDILETAVYRTARLEAVKDDEDDDDDDLPRSPELREDDECVDGAGVDKEAASANTSNPKTKDEEMWERMSQILSEKLNSMVFSERVRAKGGLESKLENKKEEITQLIVA